MNIEDELYLCIYVCEFPAQALLRLRSELRDKPCVVLEGDPPQQLVCSLNTRARLLGLRRGMTKVEVETFSTVECLPRLLPAEASVRSILLECAGSFSPRMEDRSMNGVFICILDVSGTERLFGAPPSLCRQVRNQLRRIGISASITVCSNLHAAVCLAKGLRGGLPIQIVAKGNEAVALASLPLSVLDMNEAHAETFRKWGIRTVGDLSALPEQSLISRVGQDGKRLLELARGAHPHLMQPIDQPFLLEEHMELDSPLDDLESLLFGLSTMVGQLIVRAQSRVYALALIRLTLHLEGGGTHVRTVNPRVPTNDKQLWLKLLHLDLQSHPPPAAIVAVHVYADPGATSKQQLGLFSPQTPEPGRLDVTLARISAIVGDGNVGQAVLDDTHHLSDFHLKPFVVPSAEPVVGPAQPRLCMRMLRPVERTHVTMHLGKPCDLYFRSYRFMVERAYGPWLAGGDWWSETLWGHEQWDVFARSADDVVLACRLARDLIQNTWHIEGLYD